MSDTLAKAIDALQTIRTLVSAGMDVTPTSVVSKNQAIDAYLLVDRMLDELSKQAMLYSGYLLNKMKKVTPYYPVMAIDVNDVQYWIQERFDEKSIKFVEPEKFDEMVTKALQAWSPPDGTWAQLENFLCERLEDAGAFSIEPLSDEDDPSPVTKLSDPIDELIDFDPPD